MTTLKVEVNEEKDLSLLTRVLTELGFSFSLEEDKWMDLSGAAISGINAGLKDMDEGKMLTNEQARSRISKKLKELSAQYGS